MVRERDLQLCLSYEHQVTVMARTTTNQILLQMLRMTTLNTLIARTRMAERVMVHDLNALRILIHILGDALNSVAVSTSAGAISSRD